MLDLDVRPVVVGLGIDTSHPLEPVYQAFAQERQNLGEITMAEIYVEPMFLGLTHADGGTSSYWFSARAVEIINDPHVRADMMAKVLADAGFGDAKDPRGRGLKAFLRFPCGATVITLRKRQGRPGYKHPVPYIGATFLRTSV